jgi:hypothetical protein
MSSAIIGLGMLTSAAALGSHLTLPGSQDLHHAQKSDHHSLSRELEVINNYIPPHARQNSDSVTPPDIEHVGHPSPTLIPPIAAELELLPLPFPQSSTKNIPEQGVVLGPQPDNLDHANMGWEFLLSGRPQAAMAAYREALRHHPHSANAYVGIGMAFKSMGHLELAKQAIQRSLELNPHHSSALVHMGYLYANGHLGQSDPETAGRLFTRASRLGDPFAGIALLDLQSRTSSQF